MEGKSILQNKPKIKKLKHGRNIRTSEDGNELYSEVSGNVNLTTVRDIASTGVDIISSSAIVAKAPTLDLGLDM